MTWLGDKEGLAKGDEREKLMDKRENLVFQLMTLKSKGPAGRSNAAVNGHQEDLLAIARKIANIDKQLGRT